MDHHGHMSGNLAYKEFAELARSNDYFRAHRGSQATSRQAQAGQLVNPRCEAPLKL